MKNIKLLSALIISCTMVACGGGSPESSKDKPDSLFPDGYTPATSVSSSSVSSSVVTVSSSAGANSSIDGSGSSDSSSSSVPENVIINTALPLSESFAAADNTTFFSSTYKALSSHFVADPSSSLYYPIAGLLENRILVGEGKLTIGNARFSIGQTYNATALLNSTAAPANAKINSTFGNDSASWGELDLRKKYKISFCVVASNIAGSFYIFADNNSATTANSIHGGSGTTGSRIFFQPTANLVPGKRVSINIDGDTFMQPDATPVTNKTKVIGTANSFLQVRADATAMVTIDDLWIGYQDDLATEPAASTCAAGEHLTVPPVTSSSSSTATSTATSASTSSVTSSSIVATSSTISNSSMSSVGTESSVSSSVPDTSSSSTSSSSSSRVATGWVCPTAGLYFCDDFEANNADKWDLKPTGTGNSLIPDGIFDIADDNGNYALRYTAAASGGVIALVKPTAFAGVTSADYYVEAKIRPRANSTTSNKQIYIIARYQDGNNWYAGALNVQTATTSTQVEIAKMKAGSISRPKQVKKPITMGAPGTLEGQWYSLRIELIGTTLTVYLDGENLGSVTDADFTTQGLIGFWTANKSFEVDDIKVGNPNEKPASLLLSPSASSYAAEVDDVARVVTVTAKTEAGTTDTLTVVSSNPSVVSVSNVGADYSLAPLSAGTATITITSGSNLTRTITAAIAPKFVMPTETYALAGLVTPAAGEPSSYEDQVLSLTFDAPPTLGTSGSVRIFKVSDDSLVDTIKVTGESDAIGYGTLRTLNTRPIRITGNTASITLHSNKLVTGTAYYIAISDTVFTGATFNSKAFAGIGKNAAWTFTTRATVPVAGLTNLTVDDSGTTADFRTVQSALNYVMQHVELNTAATITVKDGTYEEPLYLRNKNNVTIMGESRAGTVVQYPNNELLNSGSSGRPVILVESADLLTLENLTLKNTTLIGAGAQAEVIYFNSPTGRLIAKTTNFISEQDTVQLQGWSWFYKSLIAGNVDFIWGGSNAALFEQSEIRTLGRSTGNVNGGYVLQARVKAATDKGFVFLNSSLTSGAGPTGELPLDGAHYLARSPGGTTTFDNIVFINTKISKHINEIGWAGAGVNAQPASNPGTGTATTGWREYGSMDTNGTTLDVSKRQFGYQLSLGEIATSFCSRAQIFAAFNSNAGWDPMPSDTFDCVNLPPNTRDWNFDSAAYATAGMTLFGAAYNATTDNGIKITGGDVSVDGLIFSSTAVNVLRYRPAGSASNASASPLWNTNGSFFTSNSVMMPAVGGDVTSVRTYIAIPVVAATAFTITINYKQTGSGATAAKIALVGSDNKVLAVEDATFASSGTGDSITLSVPAGHAHTSIKILYGREGLTTGGINITNIQRVQ